LTIYEAVELAPKVAALAKVDLSQARNFFELIVLCGEAARGLGPKAVDTLKSQFDFLDWCVTIRKTYDKLDKELERDPMLAYRPANKVSLEFHSSMAFVRYFMSGNRTSKTQSGYAEHYFVVTGQHRWRNFPKPPSNTFIVGVDYKHYSKGVYEAKMVKGETDNPLSPMFPEGGKWLNHYSERDHIITIACPKCAEAGKAGSCPHPKSKIQLFSDEGSWEQLQGAQYRLGHFDEHIGEGFYDEARQRTKTVTGSCLIVTGTPLHGEEAWEIRRLYRRYLNGVPDNLYDPENPNSGLYVSVHNIDQFEAGLVPHEKIRADMADMDEFERDARVYGKPGPIADNPVFDRTQLAKLKKLCKKPARGILTTEVELNRLSPADKINYLESEIGELRVWEKPREGEVYVVGIDVAAGLRRPDKTKPGDASCASVCKVVNMGTRVALEMVAQWHGWKDPLKYAEDVMKLCVWYNSALCVIELTGGLGRAVMLKMKDEFCYWNLYREKTSIEAAKFNLDPRFGVETSQQSKPFMVAALNNLVREGLIRIPCDATIAELTAFEQENEGSGGVALLSPRFRGAGGSADDRTMSLVICASVAVSYSQLLYQVQFETAKADQFKDLSPDWKNLYGELKAGKQEAL
jgi:hypothetical protein